MVQDSNHNMKKASIIFLQFVILLIAVIALIVMIRFPLSEGRAQDLDLLSIYSDPLILYVYAASTVFFVALYKAFRFLGYIRKENLFSLKSVKNLRSIKYCAIILGILIAMAGIYIRIFHNRDDDPAGFLAMCIVLIFINIAVATAMYVFEKMLQKAVDMKIENELTI